MLNQTLNTVARVRLGRDALRAIHRCGIATDRIDIALSRSLLESTRRVRNRNPHGWGDQTVLTARYLVMLSNAGYDVGLDDRDTTLMRDIVALADEFEI